MKSSVKYFTLVVSCIFCLVLLILTFGFIADIPQLSYPITVVLPVISFLVSITGFVFLAVWGFKFSNNKQHKKLLVITLCLLLSSALIFGLAKIVNPVLSAPTVTEVKNGYLDLSVEEFENNFNEQLSKEYFRADLQKGFVDEDHAYYSCDLETGIDLTILSTADASMISYVDLSIDVNEENADGSAFGYYSAKLVYTVAPDITKDEMYDLFADIDMENPMPGDIETFSRNNIIFGLTVADDGSKIHFTAMTTK